MRFWINRHCRFSQIPTFRGFHSSLLWGAQIGDWRWTIHPRQYSTSPHGKLRTKRIGLRKLVFRTCRRMRFGLQTDTWQKVPSMWRQRFMQPESHSRLSALLLFAQRCGWHCLVADQVAGLMMANCCLQMVALPLSQESRLDDFSAVSFGDATTNHNFSSHLRTEDAWIYSRSQNTY